MGAIYEFEKEKLIIGIIYHEEEIYKKVMKILTEKFGEIEDSCEEFSFSKEFSDYYDEEIGGEGLRIIHAFKEPQDPSKQAEIKTFTNSVEKQFSVGDNRKINIDPGFMNHGRIMLATTKKEGFRIPLKDGIYTELTLFYARGGWQKLPWTYRDYQSQKVQDFLTRVRGKYLLWRREMMKQYKNYGIQSK